MDESKIVSIVLAETLPLVRGGLTALCDARPPYQVVGECGNGVDAYRLIETLLPAISLIDLDLPHIHALEIIHRVRLAGIPTKTLILALQPDRKIALDILRSGANAIVLKTGSPRHLFEAFVCVLEGGIYVAPQMDLEKLFGLPGTGKNVDPIDSLTSRERQVFSLLIEGLRAKEIARRLDLSPKTVDTYRAAMMRKLDIHDVASLVKYAIQRNLTTLPNGKPHSSFLVAAC